MHYIVGLGNPGDEYKFTRHNVAWLVLDAVLESLRLPSLVVSAKYAGRVSVGIVAGAEVTVLYPDTFMNKSGSAVKKLVPKQAADKMIVVYDDVDLPLGEIKLSVGRGAGGHNGVQSIIDTLGTKDFVRVRIGISPRSFWTKEIKRPQGAKLPTYVLGNFAKRELATVATVATHATAVIECLVSQGVDGAMNKYN